MSLFPRSSTLIDFQAATPAGRSPSGRAVERLAHSEGPQPMGGSRGWMDESPFDLLSATAVSCGGGWVWIVDTHIRSQSLTLFLFCWGDNATQTCTSTCTQRESRAWGIPTMTTTETRIIRHFSHTERSLVVLKKIWSVTEGPSREAISNYTHSSAYAWTWSGCSPQNASCACSLVKGENWHH